VVRFSGSSKALFPLIQEADARTISLPRFLLQIRSNDIPCYVRRYVASQTSLSAAVDRARHWIDAERQKERFDFLFSPAVLLVVGILLIFSWFLHPIVGWVSIARFWLVFQSRFTLRLGGLAPVSPLHWSGFIGTAMIFAVAGL